jgi:hypothetical protein
MKSSNIIFIIAIFCQTAVAEYIVPAYIDENNDWSVDVSVSSSPLNQTVRMTLKMSRFDIIPSGFPSRGPNGFLFSIPGSTNGVTQALSFISDRPDRSGTSLGILGVDMDSPLLRAAGSVAMIQLSQEGNAREGQIVIGSNFSSFNATCFPGSLMRLQIPPIRSEVTITAGGFVDNSNGIDIRILSDHVLADVPYSIEARIIRTLQGIGARSMYGSPERFSNCTRELVVASLPSIEFRKEDLGMLVLYPDEYIKFGADGHCSLLLRSALVEAAVFRVNLLKLPNINVRISNTGIVEFCDAMVDPDYVGLHQPANGNMSTVTDEPLRDSSPSSNAAQPVTGPTQSRFAGLAVHLRRILTRLRIL